MSLVWFEYIDVLGQLGSEFLDVLCRTLELVYTVWGAEVTVYWIFSLCTERRWSHKVEWFLSLISNYIDYSWTSSCDWSGEATAGRKATRVRETHTEWVMLNRYCVYTGVSETNRRVPGWSSNRKCSSSSRRSCSRLCVGGAQCLCQRTVPGSSCFPSPWKHHPPHAGHQPPAQTFEPAGPPQHAYSIPGKKEWYV